MMKELENIPDKSPFRVPEKYFEEVNRKILSATTGSEDETRNISSFHRFRPYLLIAASVTAFLIISYVAVRLLSPSENKNHLSELIREYPQEIYINDIDMYLLEENASELSLPMEISGIEKSDIIEYLLLENIEISDIYDKL